MRFAAPLLLLACQDAPSGSPSDPPPTTPTIPGGGFEAPVAAPLSDGDPVARTPHRMNVDQLKASMERVSGGIVWMEDDVVMFDDLAATLGKPDHIASTTEDLTPNLLFQKFLDDAATATCEGILDREASAAGTALLVHATLGDTWESNPDAIEENLAAALLRWHGRKVLPGEPQLEPWTFLFESTQHVGGDTRRAWTTVCVALFTHPDFYAY